MNLRRYPEAFAAFEAAIALDPQNSRAHRGRGLALVKLERYEDAVISLDHALEEDTANPELLSCKGYALYQLKRPECVESAIGRLGLGTRK